MINTTQNPLYKNKAAAKNPQTKPADPKPSAPPLTVADDKTLQDFIDGRGEAAQIAAQILKERKQSTGDKGSVLNVLV
jgi:hypothetical protein